MHSDEYQAASGGAGVAAFPPLEITRDALGVLKDLGIPNDVVQEFYRILCEEIGDLESASLNGVRSEESPFVPNTLVFFVKSSLSNAEFEEKNRAFFFRARAHFEPRHYLELTSVLHQ